MTQCTATQTQPQLEFHPNGPVAVTFDAPQSSSDGGALLLRQVDDQLGLSEGLAALVPDRRNSKKGLFREMTG